VAKEGLRTLAASVESDAMHMEVAPAVAKGALRQPLFSVMVPTCEPDEKLRQTLQSVLRQDPGAEAMQVAVVDDGSRRADVRRLLADIDPQGRIEYVANSRRLGLCGNWTRAIELARGELVHLLHQDDYVLPGFYHRMARAFRCRPDLGMAFSRSRIVDAKNRPIKTSSRLRWLPGPINRWLDLIAERQRVQTPAVVVARRTYDAVGGFRSDLSHTLDWEMWVRIAARFPVWYEPRVLAIYRRHADNETSRQLASGRIWPDISRAIEINARALPAERQARVKQASARWYAHSGLRTATKQLQAGDTEAAAFTLACLPRLMQLVADPRQHQRLLNRAAALEARLGHMAGAPAGSGLGAALLIRPAAPFPSVYGLPSTG